MCSVSRLNELESEFEKELCKSQGVQSFLCVSLISRDETLGFLGVDDCHHERNWSEFEIGTLTALANVITDGLAASKARNRLSLKKSEFESILNGQKDVIFTANYRTTVIEFANKGASCSADHCSYLIEKEC